MGWGWGVGRQQVALLGRGRPSLPVALRQWCNACLRVGIVLLPVLSALHLQPVHCWQMGREERERESALTTRSQIAMDSGQCTPDSRGCTCSEGQLPSRRQGQRYRAELQSRVKKNRSGSRREPQPLTAASTQPACEGWSAGGRAAAPAHHRCRSAPARCRRLRRCCRHRPLLPTAPPLAGGSWLR